MIFIRYKKVYGDKKFRPKAATTQRPDPAQALYDCRSWPAPTDHALHVDPAGLERGATTLEPRQGLRGVIVNRRPGFEPIFCANFTSTKVCLSVFL